MKLWGITRVWFDRGEGCMWGGYHVINNNITTTDC